MLKTTILLIALLAVSGANAADYDFEDFRAEVVALRLELIELTPTEFKLLHYLVTHAGRVLTKRQILEQVWEYDFAGNDSVVQTYISYLRRKIDVYDPPLIHTVPRVGYIVRLHSRSLRSDD